MSRLAVSISNHPGLKKTFVTQCYRRSCGEEDGCPFAWCPDLLDRNSLGEMDYKRDENGSSVLLNLDPERAFGASGNIRDIWDVWDSAILSWQCDIRHPVSF